MTVGVALVRRGYCPAGRFDLQPSDRGNLHYRGKYPECGGFLNAGGLLADRMI